jgi:hypothetical protein
MSARAIAALVVLVVAACTSSTGPIPPLRIPQLEQAQHEVEGGIGKRYQDYGACRKTATEVEPLVTCMERAGYEYIARSADTQATECWRLREVQKDRLPEALCFHPAHAQP